MTTPDTSAVRAWARKNGYDVADRGRLPAEVTEAYRATHGKAAPARKAAPTKAAPARKAAVRKAVKAPAKKPAKAAAVVAAPARRQERAEIKPAEQPRPAEPAVETPRPKPSLVSDDRRLVALGEEIKALTMRVEALEKASGGSKPSSGKTNPFRRRS